MGLTTSLYTALTGLNASQQILDVTGNNIANANTVAFKGSRAVFEDQLSQTLSGGTPPSGASGGTNPTQFGLGTTLGAVQRNMTGGAINTTGINTDVAIQGTGFFALQDAGGGDVYTRDGDFSLDANQKLVSTDGKYVQGYTVDQNFNIQSGTPTSLTIPVGKLTIAKATTNTVFAGNLDNSGTPGVTPGTAVSSALVSKTTGLPATGTTLLTDLANASAPGVNLFAANNVITISPTKGTRNLKPATLTVGAATTVNDLMTAMQNASALDPTASQVPPAGVSIGTDGKITVEGNLGTDNSISMALTSNGAVPNPMVWTATAGDGASSFTSFQAYDSVGNPVNVDLTFTMDQKTSAGTTWSFIAESADSSNPSPYLGSGTVTFDTNGNFANATGTNLIINRAGTGSVDPISFNMDLSALSGRTNGGESSVTMQTQDGYPTGTLNDFSIGQDGIITGSFSNGLSRTLGQVLVANFTNPEGLISQGNNNFVTGPNSGAANIVTPGSLGAGTLTGGALELSNVDITKEFINMVTATTAFSAAGKVISTSEQMLNELLTNLR